ncbi:MAG TPA: hypothetical protein VJ866_11895 [Pyrinomonadaceae bacterium]|nr:hypothetical protein [Pyrinomonadaceae bacterium]
MLKQIWAPLLALLGVCIGALLTGILSIINSYYQAVTVDEREKNKLILGKLEDLFDAIETVRRSYQNSLLTFHRYLIRTEAVPVAASVDEISLTIRILALINFYAPTVEPKLNQLFQYISEFSAFRKEVILFLKANRSEQDEIDRLTTIGQQRMHKISESCLEMQKEIAALSKKYL